MYTPVVYVFEKVVFSLCLQCLFAICRVQSNAITSLLRETTPW